MVYFQKSLGTAYYCYIRAWSDVVPIVACGVGNRDPALFLYLFYG